MPDSPSTASSHCWSTPRSVKPPGNTRRCCSPISANAPTADRTSDVRPSTAPRSSCSGCSTRPGLGSTIWSAASPPVTNSSSPFSTAMARTAHPLNSTRPKAPSSSPSSRWGSPSKARAAWCSAPPPRTPPTDCAAGGCGTDSWFRSPRARSSAPTAPTRTPENRCLRNRTSNTARASPSPRRTAHPPLRTAGPTTHSRPGTPPRPPLTRRRCFRGRAEAPPGTGPRDGTAAGRRTVPRPLSPWTAPLRRPVGPRRPSRWHGLPRRHAHTPPACSSPEADRT